MKVEVVLEPERTDIQVTIHAPAATAEVEALAARLPSARRRISPAA